jgi:hypothetical protein
MIITTITQRRRFTALRAAWPFDGSSATLTGNPTVVLDGASILAIDAGTSPLPDNAEVVGLSGATPAARAGRHQ